jgi:uncharacterized protein YjeT (DUF2065 family)
VTPLLGFLTGIGLLLVLDGLVCLLAPLLRSNIHWQRAMQTSEQIATRGRWLLAAGTGLLLLVGAMA